MKALPCPLVDVHLHLQDDFLAARLEEVVGLARAGGVEWFCSNGAEERDWPVVLAQARAHPEIVPCFGLHPWYVSERSPQWLEQLEWHLEAIPSAVGEIGLDRWKEPRDEAAQEEVFRAQLAVARRRELPVMIHCVRAWGWLMEVLRSEAALPAGFLLHAYGGPVELIQPLAEMGAYFSYGGSTLDERKKLRRETLPQIPRDRLLLETDAPDMPPPPAHCVRALQDAGGRRVNEPANLRPILQGVAALLGMEEEELAEQLWANSRRFLGRWLMART
ncbi:TatD family hydrolase [Fontisphaera persica]|uniref:TatD family hydrolase n=1 Tax=Fontisphaera persica TaxID=2974023 RepID=UPI0024BF3B0C|nr:TatD family hydrolase [Fontisphaera persica]WCJ58002.1 TatD family hydrolase [Fontisphaera persica]